MHTIVDTAAGDINRLWCKIKGNDDRSECEMIKNITLGAMHLIYVHSLKLVNPKMWFYDFSIENDDDTDGIMYICIIKY